MSILDLRTDDSLASAPGYMRPRKPVAPMSWGGLFSAPFRGIGEAGAQVWASALEVATSYGDIMARVDDGRSLTDRDMLVETDISKAMREAGRSLRPDPETASTAEQIIYGFARGATKVVGGSILAGPFGAVGAGVEEGISAADDLKREGVDLVTRMQAGGVQGAGLALAALPLLGTTIGKTAALYVAGGPGGFIAQQALTREILQGAGYDELGDSYDPFDPVGLAVSSLIPAVFTAAGLRAGAKRARVSKEVSDAARVAYEIEQRNATSPVSRDDFAAVAKHAEALAKAEEQVARGEPVQVSDVAPRITPEQRDANFREWFGESKVVDESGAPLVLYHGTPTPETLTSFRTNADGAQETGDAYGRGAYLTTDAAEAGRYANNRATGDVGAVLPLHVRGRVLDVDKPLNAAESERLSILAEKLLLPSDKARFEAGRETRTFSDVQDARDFFDVQRENWKQFGDGMDRARPEATADGGAFTVEYTNFDAPIKIKSGADAYKFFRAVGWDNLGAAGYDGLMMGRESGAKWVVMHNSDGNVKSAIGNSGKFDPNSASLTDPIAQLGAAVEELRAARAELDGSARPDSPDQVAQPRQPAEANVGTPRDLQAEMISLRKSQAGLKDVETARTEGRTLYEPAPEQAAEVAANPSRVEEVTRQFPDMMVKMDDMDEAMPASEFIAMAKAEADDMVADAPLLQVAAECALLHGV